MTRGKNKVIRRKREKTMDNKELEKLLSKLHEYLSKIREELYTEISSKEECTDDYMSLSEFFFQTKVCHPNTISRLLSSDEDFFNKCAIWAGRMYYVKPKATLAYLASEGSDKMRKKIHDFLTDNGNHHPCLPANFGCVS